MKLSFDAVVIGSGPAGISASIYLKRANLSVAMIDANAPGGQMNRIPIIENYPGFSRISGADLAYNMFMQTQELGINYIYSKVMDILIDGAYKVIKTDKNEIKCKTVVIASGRKPRELGLPNEKGLIGRGVSWCAICDGSLFKDRDVVVVGGGNSALMESLYLASIVNKITIVHHSEKFRADQKNQDLVLKNPKINVLFNSTVTKLNAIDDRLDSIEIENNKTKELKKIYASGLFIYIGFEPSIEYASNLNLNNDKGYIIVDDDMKTNVSGIYACGDAIKKSLYLITTAVAEGTKAAMSAIRYIEEFDKNIHN